MKKSNNYKNHTIVNKEPLICSFAINYLYFSIPITFLKAYNMFLYEIRPNKSKLDTLFTNIQAYIPA